MGTILQHRIKVGFGVLILAFAAMLGIAGQASGSASAGGSHVAAKAAEAQPTPTSGSDQHAGINGCWVVSKTYLKIRQYPTTTSAALGQLSPGESATASCTATSGGTYTACGGTSYWWIYIVRGGTQGYVAWLCVDWYISG